jgi:hypothetical protein
MQSCAFLPVYKSWVGTNLYKTIGLGRTWNKNTVKVKNSGRGRGHFVGLELAPSPSLVRYRICETLLKYF